VPLLNVARPCCLLRAEDTIITWTDTELGTDIALSFQEAAGCNYVW
jgi:protein phosphatase 4 regulatory subunit 3